MKLSSVTQKIIIAFAGLFLILFLCVHLTINLFLLRNDNGEWFHAASNFMSSNYIIKAFEIILFGGFLLHILMGLVITLKNWISRPIKYKRTNKSETSFFSKYMFHTGVIIFVFLLIHFINFYFVRLGLVKPPVGVDAHDFYSMAIILFNNKLYSIIYIIALAILGLHLNHAFQSAFQTLGLNHRKYTPLIKGIGTAYAIIVPVGFAIIPVFFMFFH